MKIYINLETDPTPTSEMLQTLKDEGFIVGAVIDYDSVFRVGCGDVSLMYTEESPQLLTATLKTICEKIKKALSIIEIEKQALFGLFTHEDGLVTDYYLNLRVHRDQWQIAAANNELHEFLYRSAVS